MDWGGFIDDEAVDSGDDTEQEDEDDDEFENFNGCSTLIYMRFLQFVP